MRPGTRQAIKSLPAADERIAHTLAPDPGHGSWSRITAWRSRLLGFLCDGIRRAEGEQSRAGWAFVPSRPLRLGRDAPSKLAAGRISEDEVHALLEDHVVVKVVEERNRYVLLGRVRGRALIAVVADDELDDATVLISVCAPDAEHGWTTDTIDRTLRGDGPEEAPQ